MRPPVKLALVGLLLAWSVSLLAQPTTVFYDTFTEATTNTDLASHTPDTGASWAEVIDSAANNGIEANSSSGRAKATTTRPDQRIVYRAMPTSPCGADCDVSLTTSVMDGTTARPAALIFGYADASNYCAVLIYTAADDPDVQIVKVVADSASALASGTINTGPATGDVWKMERRGSAITLRKNTVSILTPSDAACNTGNGTGLGFGNILTATDDISAAWRLDDFTVVNQTAGGGGGGGGTGGGGGLMRRSGL